MEKRRLGRFKIAEPEMMQARNGGSKIPEIFNRIQFTPLEAETSPCDSATEYRGHSPAFEEIELGRYTPEYNLIVTEAWDGSIEDVKVEKI